MKKIFNLSIFTLLFLSVMSCSTDDNKIVVNTSTNPVLLAPESGTTVTLNAGAPESTALTLVWDHAAYTVDTEITYTVEMAVAGTDFAAPVELGTTTSRVLLLNNNVLRDKLTDEAPDGLGLTDEEDANVEVRVTASLGDNADLPMVSEPLAFTVDFGGEVVEPVEPVLFLVGQVQSYYGLNAWDNTTAIPMRYIGDGETLVFEAYVKVGAGDGFKFIGQQGSWDNGNYGTIGGVQDGNLENSGGSGDIKVAETDGAGQYYVWVDLDNLEYKSVKMQWGIIGDATPGAWNDETPMTYDFASNTWSITTALNSGEMKFRSSNTGNFIASDAWKFNIGNSDPMVTYNPAAGNFPITAGSYTLGLTVNFDGTASVTGL
jgi:hypothetical protein